MKPQEFMTLLAERRVSLSGEGGVLQFRAPEGALDENLKAMLRRYKEELLNILRDQTGYLLLCPISYNQQSLFFLSLLEPSSAAYNLALSMKLRPAVDANKLNKALEQLIQRHEQLRTTYGHVELGESLVPIQFVHELLSPSFETIEAQDWSDVELAERLQVFYRTPIDLRNGPMVRAGLFLRGEAEAVLVAAVHHIAADAWSMNLIKRDLAAALRGELDDPKEGPINAEYTDFVLAQHRALADVNGRAHLAYWLGEHTTPAPKLEFGNSKRRPAMRRSIGATHYFHIESAVRDRVELSARNQELTSFALLLSVFQWVLFDRTGQRDVVVGIPTLGRTDRRFENTIGYFVNPIPLRSRRTGEPRFQDHAKATAHELRVALDHRDASFAAVVERLGGARDTSRTPVFQVMFNLLSRKTLADVIDLLYPVTSAPEVDFGGLKATAYALDQQEGQFDVTLELIDYGDRILGLLKYCTDLFTPEEAADLASAYCARLDVALSAPDTVLFPAAAGAAENAAPEDEGEVIAVSATFTAEVLQEFAEFWFQRLGWRAGVRYAPFNQVFQELLDPASLLRSNQRGHNCVLVRIEDLLLDGGGQGPNSLDGMDVKLAQVLEELQGAIATATKSMKVSLCFVLCPPSKYGEEIQRRGKEAIERFLAALRTLPGVSVLTHEQIYQWYPVADYQETLGETIGRIPYTLPYFAALATAIARTLHAVSRKPIKAIVVDCDGTLWDGVVGEDGPTGVIVGPLQQGFQQFLHDQHRAGVVLCLCSKNQEADVWAVLDQHPGMLLRREHFAFSKINWGPKSENIRALATEMNLGLDAIAFLDDNPVERAEVRMNCPLVFCMELPAAWEERSAWLEHVWLLDHTRVTAEDLKRQEHYRTEQLRDDLKQNAGSLHEFLEKLELKIELRPANEADYDRLSQLSIRTNQFNTTTLRLTAQEVAGYAEVPGRSAHIARVSDRFGDYGMVGGMLARVEGKTLWVEGLFLSCRALGRGVEHRMAAYLGDLAQQAGCSGVAFPMRTTDRNEPARIFLARLKTLCNGALDGEGALSVSAERLAVIRYETIATAAEAEVSETSPSRKTSEDNSDALSQDRELFSSIAGHLQSIGAVLHAVDELRREHRGKSAFQRPTGPAIAPETQTERLIADVWKRVLGLVDVSTHSNFFEAGGTSLLMARIAIELGRDHGLKVSLVDLFQYPTIAGLARHLDGKGTVNEGPGRAEEAAVRQRAALSDRQLPGSFKRLKKVRG